MRASWSISSKHALMSASSTQLAPRLAVTRIGFERLVGGALRAEPEALRGEVGLEDGFEDDLGRRHDHPVSAPWGCRAAGSHPACPASGCAPAATASGDTSSARSSAASPSRNTSHPVGAPVADRRNADAVDAGGTLVGRHVDPRPPHHVAAGDLVVEGVEPSVGSCLALR